MSRIRRLLRLKTLLRIGLVAFVIWCCVLVYLSIRVITYGEIDNAQNADVIIVLGSGLRRNGQPGDALYRRSVWASQVYHQGLAPVVICTGGVGINQTRSEASACREILLSRGVPDEAIYLDEQSGSTEENAIFSQQIMDSYQWNDAILVTDSFHMLRANWIFNSVGIDHTRSPVPREWMRRVYFVRHFTREILALHWQAFKDLFNLPFTSVPLV